MKKLSTKKIITDLNYNVVNFKYANLDKMIIGTTLGRANIDLWNTQKFQPSKSSVIAWDKEEANYLIKLNKAKRKHLLSNSLSLKTSLLFLTMDFDAELKSEIISVANSFKIPVVLFPDEISVLQLEVIPYLMQKQIHYKFLHGSLVTIHGMGVFIKGESGIGKSEAVLELIHNGHIFVADDSVEVYKIGTKIFGKPSYLTKDFLEARGIGFINIPYIYGAKAMIQQTKIDLVVELVSENQKREVDRLGNGNLTEKIYGIKINKVKIPTGTGRSIAILIEAATNVYLAKKQGLDPIREIAKRKEKDNG